MSMAPADTIPVLREALAMGADEAVLLSDIAFAGSGTLATSYILSAAIKKLAPYDPILCGDQTLDASTGQVGTQLAEFLGIPDLIHVSVINTLKSGEFRVHCKIEYGSIEVEIKPPMVLSVVKEINEPRYITLMNILQGEEKRIEIWSSKVLKTPRSL